MDEILKTVGMMVYAFTDDNVFGILEQSKTLNTMINSEVITLEELQILIDMRTDMHTEWPEYLKAKKELCSLIQTRSK